MLNSIEAESKPKELIDVVFDSLIMTVKDEHWRMFSSCLCFNAANSWLGHPGSCTAHLPSTFARRFVACETSGPIYLFEPSFFPIQNSRSSFLQPGGVWCWMGVLSSHFGTKTNRSNLVNYNFLSLILSVHLSNYVPICHRLLSCQYFLSGLFWVLNIFILSICFIFILMLGQSISW